MLKQKRLYTSDYYFTIPIGKFQYKIIIFCKIYLYKTAAYITNVKSVSIITPGSPKTEAKVTVEYVIEMPLPIRFVIKDNSIRRTTPAKEFINIDFTAFL